MSTSSSAPDRPGAGTAIGVALVGFGSAGRQHAQALSGSRFARLRAILDANPEVEVPDGVARYASWPDLLADPDVQVVSLCTPPGGRADLAHQALESGKAVLLEKPPVTNLAELDALVELAEARRLPVGVMLQHRMRLPQDVLDWSWSPSTTATLQVARFRPTAHFRREGWRQDPANALGGITAHLGVHYLDLACQLLGEPDEITFRGIREVSPGIDIRTASVVRFTSGATLAFTVTGESTVRSERLDVLGIDQRVTIEDGRVATDSGRGLADHSAAPTADLRGEVYREMAEAVRHGRQPARCHLAGARGVTRILEAVRSGQWELL